MCSLTHTHTHTHTHTQLVKQQAPNAPLLFDVRNFYESEVGWFQGAEPLDTATFRDTWDALKEKLRDVDKVGGAE